MSKKSFASLPKPARQPTAEEIEAFEETGTAQAAPGVTAPAPAEKRKAVNTEPRVHGNTERREPAKAEIRDGVNTETQNGADAETRKHGAAEGVVRLTIDLPESVHTRFKAACAVARRKMVQEVRLLIEERTAELEGANTPPR